MFCKKRAENETERLAVLSVTKNKLVLIELTEVVRANSH